MRLPVDRFLPFAAPIFAIALLTGCGGAPRSEIAAAPIASGPGADYPVVVGQPFTIEGITYTPVDKMNIDQVGYAYTAPEGGTAISGAHRTLPLPSYVEITSLESGKTILVRIERRGPMAGDGLVELSPGAAAQLGIDPASRTPVRVRRVNPPEIERAALRGGQRAPDRMDTPKSLLAVLLRKLDPGLPGGTPSSGNASLPNLATIAAGEKARPSAPAIRPTLAPKPAVPPPTTGRAANVVQVGAFSSKANAEASAAKLGGNVTAVGRLWRVRMGPYTAYTDAAAALAKAKGAGYSDARIQRAD